MRNECDGLSLLFGKNVVDEKESCIKKRPVMIGTVGLQKSDFQEEAYEQRLDVCG